MYWKFLLKSSVWGGKYKEINKYYNKKYFNINNKYNKKNYFWIWDYDLEGRGYFIMEEYFK